MTEDPDPHAEAVGDEHSRVRHEEESRHHDAAAELHAQAAEKQDDHVRHSEEVERRRNEQHGGSRPPR